jgi:hypothetical protein
MRAAVFRYHMSIHVQNVVVPGSDDKSKPDGTAPVYRYYVVLGLVVVQLYLKLLVLVLVLGSSIVSTTTSTLLVPAKQAPVLLDYLVPVLVQYQ